MAWRRSGTSSSVPRAGAISGAVGGGGEVAAAVGARGLMGGSGARSTAGASSAQSRATSRESETLALSSSLTTYGMIMRGVCSMLSSVVVVKAIDGVTAQRVAPSGGAPHARRGGSRMYAAKVALTCSRGGEGGEGLTRAD